MGFSRSFVIAALVANQEDEEASLNALLSGTIDDKNNNNTQNKPIAKKSWW